MHLYSPETIFISSFTAATFTRLAQNHSQKKRLVWKQHISFKSNSDAWKCFRWLEDGFVAYSVGWIYEEEKLRLMFRHTFVRASGGKTFLWLRDISIPIQSVNQMNIFRPKILFLLLFG